jgi:hypothetical protein
MVQYKFTPISEKFRASIFRVEDGGSRFFQNRYVSVRMCSVTMQNTVIFVHSPPIFQTSHVYFAIHFVDTYVALFSPAIGISVIKFRQYLPAS